MTQLGTSFGLSITTIIFNRVKIAQAEKMGYTLDATGDGAPKEAQLLAYRAAEWGAFAFGIIGTLLAFAFLRGVGIVGGSKKDDERTLHGPDADEDREVKDKV